MNKIDYLSLSGHSLRTFLIVLEELSVSKAAARLGVSQSAVSHSLEKLRTTFNDPLFVRSGRNIDATERAISLREPIQIILDGLKGLTDERAFDPKTGTLEFKIAANDFQRSLIFPTLLNRLHKSGVDAQLHFIASGIPDASLLRQEKCQLMVTPFPPEGPDIYQLKLFDDHLMCFYDATMRKAPKTWKEFYASDLIEAKFSDQQSALTVLFNQDKSKLSTPIVSVPNFEALEPFILGSKRITVAMSLMKNGCLKQLDTATLPFKTKTLPMYLIWHKRDHTDPAHQWFREQIQLTLKTVLKSSL
ncbi:LysR family transcriptional regulator [Marinomonas sp. 15G1-11]|uniref:LysR family transcriptional regulator n=1 Tax=Marinomonas phaeophyticola TaxID=3004091 RepID=A0ABT4JZ02_9GAMM|nr:LysR family transcriptional regulator [Marinomonas sp. 15G1-11]MCZ2723451.1 LysR family transcriptional regulator [Marinomonas sp. 15G1-11]